MIAAVEIDDHALAHAVERAVAAAHADIGRDHEIAEGVRLVGEAPRLPDRGRIAGGSEHDFRALVGALARHLREHAIMADDERELATARAIDDGNAQIARLPRLDGHPRVQLAIIELHLALVVDDDAGVVGIAPRVELHDGETAPDLVLDAGRLERRDFRPIHPAHDGRVRVHRQAVQRVFGEYDQVHRPQIAARLADHRDDARSLRGEIVRRDDHGQLKLHEADDDAVLGFVQTAKPVHWESPFIWRVRSSAGSAFRREWISHPAILSVSRPARPARWRRSAWSMTRRS